MRWEPERVDDRDEEGVVVCRAVADPSWAVSHVLLYGGEAEVMEPEEMRGLVRETAERVVT